MAPTNAPRTYVLDTSVLIGNPHALAGFAGQRIVLPIVVINELERKRHDPEVGYYARTALRELEQIRIANAEGLEGEIDLANGTKLLIELNRTDPASLPTGMNLRDNDTKILAVAASFKADVENVVLVSKDLPMRVKAGAVGLRAEEPDEGTAQSTWSGMVNLDVTAEDLDQLYSDGTTRLTETADLPVNTGLRLTSHRGSALARVNKDKDVQLIRRDVSAFGLTGRSAEQKVALDLLLDPEIGIVSLGGRAGTGKSALALAAGFDAVMERGLHKKVIVFRPLYPVGGQELGFLPGSEAEKMGPWAQAVFDTLGATTSRDVLDEILARGMLEVLPLTHIRGRSLHDTFVIVDEAQQLERQTLLTVLSRLGEGSKVVLTHDVAQRDNLRVGRHDGIGAVVEKLKGHPLFGHTTLTRSERSPIAALVTEMLDADLNHDRPAAASPTAPTSSSVQKGVAVSQSSPPQPGIPGGRSAAALAASRANAPQRSRSS